RTSTSSRTPPARSGTTTTTAPSWRRSRPCPGCPTACGRSCRACRIGSDPACSACATIPTARRPGPTRHNRCNPCRLTIRASVPYRVGPSMLGMRDNPCGAAPVPNPENRRIAMALNDPRQRGLFGAAWNLGYAARMAAAGVEALTLSAPVGAFGVVYAETDFPQPWFAERGRGVYPVYHVLRGLAAAAGAAQLATAVSHGSSVQALAYRRDGAVVLWLANLTGRAQRVRLDGLPGARARSTLLA